MSITPVISHPYIFDTLIGENLLNAIETAKCGIPLLSAEVVAKTTSLQLVVSMLTSINH
jgi:hypothetical protein